MISTVRLLSCVFATLLWSQSAVAQVTASQLEEVVAIIESGDAEAFAAKDRTIDYIPEWRTLYYPSDVALKLFEGCEAANLDTADNSYGMTMLRFECPERVPPFECTTGDLDLMLEPRYGLSIAVSEVRIIPSEENDCRIAVPPAPPSSSDTNGAS